MTNPMDISQRQFLDRMADSAFKGKTRAEVQQAAVNLASELVGAEAASLLQVDAATGELTFEVALGDKGSVVRTIRLKKGQGIAGAVAETGQPAVVNDAQSDPRFYGGVDRQSRFVTRNMVCVPVTAGGKVIGVLQAINKKAGDFTDADLEIFNALARQIAATICLNLKDLQLAAIESATALVDAEAGSLLLVDQESGKLSFQIALGEGGEVAKTIVLEKGQGIAGAVAESGQPTVVNDVQSDPRFYSGVDRQSRFVTRNMVCVPVMADERVVAVLQVLNKKDGAFTDQDLETCKQIAGQLSVSVKAV